MAKDDNKYIPETLDDLVTTVRTALRSIVEEELKADGKERTQTELTKAVKEKVDKVVESSKKAFEAAYEGEGKNFGLTIEEAGGIAKLIYNAQKEHGDKWNGRITSDSGESLFPATLAKNFVMATAERIAEEQFTRAEKIAKDFSDEGIIQRMKEDLAEEKSAIQERNGDVSAVINAIGKYEKAAAQYAEKVGTFSAFAKNDMAADAEAVAAKVKAAVLAAHELAELQKAYEKADKKDPEKKTEIDEKKVELSGGKKGEEKIKGLEQEAVDAYNLLIKGGKDGDKDVDATYKNKDKDTKTKEAFDYNVQKAIDNLFDDSEFEKAWKAGASSVKSPLGEFAKDDRTVKYSGLKVDLQGVSTRKGGAGAGKGSGSDDKGGNLGAWTAAALGLGTIIASAATGKDEAPTAEKPNGESKWSFARVTATIIGAASAAIGIAALVGANKGVSGGIMNQAKGAFGR